MNIYKSMLICENKTTIKQFMSQNRNFCKWERGSIMGLCIQKGIPMLPKVKFHINQDCVSVASNALESIVYAAAHSQKQNIHNLSTSKQKSKKKKWKILIIVIVILLAWGAISSQKDTELKTLSLSAIETPIDIKETPELSWSYTPENADLSRLEVESSDTSIAEVSLSDGRIKLQPKAEGEVNITLHSENVESNSITITIVDEERIAAEQAEKERLEAEQAEQERLAAEKAEQERLAAEQAEQERLEAAEQAQAEQEAAQQQAQQQSNSRTVYVTPTGKRYHYDNNCNGGTYTPTTLDDAVNRGLTPCKKCAS